MPLVDTILSGSEIDFNEGIFPDLIGDFATRCFETPEKIQERYESTVDFVESSIKNIINNYSAMRNWRYKVLPLAMINENKIRKAENNLKSKLRILDRVWAIGIIPSGVDGRGGEIFDDDYTILLYLRVGPKNEFEKWENESKDKKI